MHQTELNITLVLVVLTGFISWQGFQKPDLLRKLLMSPYQVKQHREYYRFLTAGFVHGNWGHLLINLYVLYQFGGVVEVFFMYLAGPLVGPILFVLFYLSALAISCLPAFNKHRDNPWYAELGASGATAALVFTYILMDPWQWFLFPPLPAILLGGVFLWYFSYMGKHHPDDRIAHHAHFAGALYGLVFTISATLLFRPVFLVQFIGKLLQGPSWPF